MPRPPTPSRRRLAAGLLLAFGGAALLWWRPWRADPPAGDPFPLPPVSASPYLNTGPDAAYVGSAGCQGCHQERHATFRTTGMGRSMAVVEPDREPADADFDHPPSGRRYEVRRRDGRMWHRELLRGGGPGEVLLAEHPVEYVVGSGRHSRT
jgi:hypothetical protein